MASNTLTGFRGPAKRTAFGDVTNVAKNIGSASTLKMVKPFAGTFSQPSSTRLLNKENAPFAAKDTVSDHVQKPAMQLATTMSAHESRPLDNVERPATSAAYDFPSLQQEVIEEEPSAVAEPREEYAVDVESSRVPNHSTLLQPRQHKSQPDLKAQQQTLRRTQSRVIERPQTVDEVSENGTPGLDNVEMFPPRTDRESVLESTEAASTDTTLAADVAISDQAPDLDDGQVPDEDEDAGFLDQILGRDHGLLPARSEPEECWAEDEDDYDDEDFATFDALDETTGIPAVLQPKVTARVQRELEDAKLEVQRTRTFDDIEEETWDVSMVAEYGDEIFEYMRELEVSTATRLKT